MVKQGWKKKNPERSVHVRAEGVSVHAREWAPASLPRWHSALVPPRLWVATGWGETRQGFKLSTIISGENDKNEKINKELNTLG